MLRRPIEREKPAAAEAFETTFEQSPVSFGHMSVEGVHVPQGHRCAVHILHVDIGHMKAVAEQLDVGLRLVAEELGAPNPGFPAAADFGTTRMQSRPSTVKSRAL